MNYRLIPSKYFQKEAKRFAKKFPSLRTDLEDFKVHLLDNPRSGTPLGNDAYKHRLAIRSKTRGKSGGMRILTYLTIDLMIDDMTNVYLLAIYDKSETQTLTKKEITRMIGDLK
jgi:mRNA-degrading endonuclease RelE of RelBE toxin-antitoxin system